MTAVNDSTGNTKPALTEEQIKRIDGLIQEAALRCGAIYDLNEARSSSRSTAVQSLAKEAFRILDNALSQLLQSNGVIMGRFQRGKDMPDWRKGVQS
jgi:hypothetical protein